MPPDELMARYFLSRLLWWRSDLERLDAEAIAQLVAALVKVKADILAQLDAEAKGLAAITDWSRERMQALDRWADEVLAEANAVITGTVSESAVLAATASLATYNAMLSFEGKASAVRTVGMTAEQIRAWFQDTPLGGGTLQHWVDRAFSNGVKKSLLTAIRTAGIEGKGIAETVKRVMRQALDEGVSITRREAVMLVRTYVQTANNQAMEAVYAANDGIIKGYKRVETLDNRTCRICALADGMEYGLHEKRPELPAHPGCVIGETPIFAPDYIAAFVSTYSGPVFELTFANGARCTVTANHMFLTDNGFSTAKALRKGDNVFCRPDKIIRSPSLAPDNNGNPARIDQVVESFSKSRGVVTRRVPASPEQFHGDGEFIQGYVDIIAPDSLLNGEFDAFIEQFLGKDFFTSAGRTSDPLYAHRVFPSEFFALWTALDCHVSGLSISDIFLRASSGHHQSIGGSIVSDVDAKFFKNGNNDNSLTVIPPCKCVQGLSTKVKFPQFVPRNSASDFTCGQTHFMNPSDNSVDGNAEFSRHLRKSLIGVIPLTQVVSIKEVDFFGHVYDLQTVSSLYYINGIVTSNCRGVYIPITKTWRDFGIDRDELEAVARPWVLREPGPIGTGGRKIEEWGTTKENFKGWWFSLNARQKAKTSIGAVREKLLLSGAVKWEDLTDKATGLPYTLEQLGFDQRGNPF